MLTPELLLFCLFGAHFLYDFHWQGDFVGQNKGKSLFILLIHAFTWAFVLGVVLIIFGCFNYVVVAWWMFTHAFIDGMKSVALSENKRTNLYLLYVDQILHAVTIVVGFLWVLK